MLLTERIIYDILKLGLSVYESLISLYENQIHNIRCSGPRRNRKASRPVSTEYQLAPTQAGKGGRDISSNHKTTGGGRVCAGTQSFAGDARA